jgi:hypothetical protein
VTELLPLLDAAIDKLDACDCSRCPRSSLDLKERAGTHKLLSTKAVPAVPVVPASEQEGCNPLPPTPDADCSGEREGRAHEYPSKLTGITGTTGTSEAFCGSAVPIETEENGNERVHAKPETSPVERHAITPMADHLAIVGQNAKIVAPVQWFEGAADAEPAYHEPWPGRRGMIRRRDGRFEHFCVTCGAWGAFGYGVAADRPGRWFCFSHRPESS